MFTSHYILILLLMHQLQLIFNNQNLIGIYDIFIFILDPIVLELKNYKKESVILFHFLKSSKKYIKKQNKMQQQESATNMVLKQVSQNPKEKFVQKVNMNAQFNDTSYSKNFFTLNQDNQYFHEKDLQGSKQHFQSNKENSTTGFHSKLRSVNSTELTESDFIKATKKQIEKNQTRKKSNKLKTIQLQKNSHQQSYIRKLRQYLPQGHACSSKLIRNYSLFSLDSLNLFIKQQQMLRFYKTQGCFSGSYDIISQNKFQNKVGILKSDLTGSIFNIYEQKPTQTAKLIGTIFYNNQFTFHSSPRKIQMFLLKQNQILEGTQNGIIDTFINLKDLYETEGQQKIVKIVNRAPQVNELNQLCLDFGQENIIPSKKNTILQVESTQKIVLMMYKSQQNEYQLKIKSGISVFIAYCFALSSLVFKLACQ